MSDSTLFARLVAADVAVRRWAEACRNPRKFQPVMRAEFARAFDRRESLVAKAIKADPVTYARTFPGSAFAVRYLLPADMAARVEAAETDSDIVAALADAPAMVPQPCQQQQACAGRPSAPVEPAPGLECGDHVIGSPRINPGHGRVISTAPVWAMATDARGFTTGEARDIGTALVKWCDGSHGRYPRTELRVVDVRPDHAVAADPVAAAEAYESRRVPADGELTYSSPDVLADCVRRAFAAGWRLDTESAAAGEWPWFVTMAHDDGRCVRHGDGWRLYVETAAEALAELGKADTVALVTVGEAH